jgi:hypothetical protein
MPADIAYTIFQNSHESIGVTVREPWINLCARLEVHRVGTKDGTALTCCTFALRQPRRNVNVIQRTMVALDIETSQRYGEIPVSFDAAVDYFRMRRVAAMLWTTHSHTPEMPRYRVLMPLSRAVDYDPLVDPHMSAMTAADCNRYHVSDPSKFGAASLFFWPRHAGGAATPSEYKTIRVDGDFIDSGSLLTAARIRAEHVEQNEAEVAARREARALPPEIRALIENYNQTHPLVEQLNRYGYVRDGNRFKSRYQHNGSQGATSILPDGVTWVSFSESDAQAGVGARPARASSQCACFGDAFSLYAHYEHGGSFRAAVDFTSPRVDLRLPNEDNNANRS